MSEYNQYCSLPKKNKLWINDPITLVCEWNKIIPSENMCKNEKVNTITRLIIYVFILMMLFNYSKSFEFLLTSLIITLILYYVSLQYYKK